MPEIQQADRDRCQEWHDFDATLAPIDASDKQRLLECLAAHREAAVAGVISVLQKEADTCRQLGFYKTAAHTELTIRQVQEEFQLVAALGIEVKHG